MKREPVIDVTDVSFRYHDAAVLDGVSFAVESGELAFIVGPNGAGKSTLLRLIAGLRPPSDGTVRCFGLDPFATPRVDVAAKLAFLPQSYNLTFPFRVEEVVLLGRYAHGRNGLGGFYTRAADRDRAREAMTRCDVADFAERRWDQLSGGEQRRVLLAQAFCQDAPLLLLDEPTASLDPAHAIEIIDAVLERPKDSTAVIVTHDLNLAARYGEKLALLHKGQIASVGPPAEVLASDQTRAVFGIDFHLDRVPGTQKLFVVPK